MTGGFWGAEVHERVGQPRAPARKGDEGRRAACGLVGEDSAARDATS